MGSSSESILFKGSSSSKSVSGLFSRLGAITGTFWTSLFCSVDSLFDVSFISSKIGTISLSGLVEDVLMSDKVSFSPSDEELFMVNTTFRSTVTVPDFFQYMRCPSSVLLLGPIQVPSCPCSPNLLGLASLFTNTRQPNL